MGLSRVSVLRQERSFSGLSCQDVKTFGMAMGDSVGFHRNKSEIGDAKCAWQLACSRV